MLENSRKILDIIPCKEYSERLPNKNILPISGKMCFEWSVEYAINKGIKSVIFTDGEFVID